MIKNVTIAMCYYYRSGLSNNLLTIKTQWDFTFFVCINPKFIPSHFDLIDTGRAERHFDFESEKHFVSVCYNEFVSNLKYSRAVLLR